jgi:hypothetical protein
MIVPEYAGSWGAVGGFFAIIGGVFYIWITLLEAQYTASTSPWADLSKHWQAGIFLLPTREHSRHVNLSSRSRPWLPAPP